MDILSLLSNLQNSNLDLTKVLGSLSSIFSTNKNTDNYTPQNNNPNTYYELPNYNFGNQNDTKSSKIFAKNYSSMPQNTTKFSQNTSQNSLDINKVMELAQVLLPLVSSMKKEKKAMPTQNNVDTADKKSEILSLTRI